MLAPFRAPGRKLAIEREEASLARDLCASRPKPDRPIVWQRAIETRAHKHGDQQQKGAGVAAVGDADSDSEQLARHLDDAVRSDASSEHAAQPLRATSPPRPAREERPGHRLPDLVEGIDLGEELCHRSARTESEPAADTRCQESLDISTIRAVASAHKQPTAATGGLIAENRCHRA